MSIERNREAFESAMSASVFALAEQLGVPSETEIFRVVEKGDKAEIADMLVRLMSVDVRLATTAKLVHRVHTATVAIIAGKRIFTPGEAIETKDGAVVVAYTGTPIAGPSRALIEHEIAASRARLRDKARRN